MKRALSGIIALGCAALASSAHAAVQYEFSASDRNFGVVAFFRYIAPTFVADGYVDASQFDSCTVSRLGHPEAACERVSFERTSALPDALNFNYLYNEISGLSGGGIYAVFGEGALDNFGYYTFNSDGVGASLFISEVADAVPEPATWLMMIAGFGAIGSAMRRRKPNVSIQFA